MKEDYLFYASLARENFMWCKVTKKTMFNKMLYKHYVLKAHEEIKGKLNNSIKKH